MLSRFQPTAVARAAAMLAAVTASLTAAAPALAQDTQRVEILGSRLNTIHNLHFYQALMRDIRDAIATGRFGAWRADFERRTARAVAEPVA